MKIQPGRVDPRIPNARVVASATPARAPGVDHELFDASTLLAIGAFALYVAAALLGVGGRTLTFAYPAGCFLIALIAYVRSPGTYIALTWWLWLLTPCVRRVFDLRYGFHSTSPLLLGPLLCTSVSVFTLIHRRRSLRNVTYVPFIAASVALGYAFMTGALKQSPFAAAYDLITWMVPLLFGLHLALEWRQYARTRAVIVSAILSGLLVTSTYGIVQFVNPPLWDRAWVVNAEVFSVGAPLPFLIRAFSTLNTPAPFAIMLVFGLLIGLAAPQRWRAVALALGLVALILTKERAGWGALVLGGLVFQFRQPLRSLPRQWIALLVILLLAAPVITQPRVMSVLTGRASTLYDVSADRSFNVRLATMRNSLRGLGSNPTGNGLGGFGGASKLLSSNVRVDVALDSGLLEVLAVFGWIGGTLFLIALGAIILPILRDPRSRRDPIAGASGAVVIALFAMSLFRNVFNSVSGFFFWTAVGLAIAARTYSAATAVTARFSETAALPRQAGPTLPPRTTAA